MTARRRAASYRKSVLVPLLSLLLLTCSPAPCGAPRRPRARQRRLPAPLQRDEPASRHLHEPVGLRRAMKSSIFSAEPVSSSDMVSWPTSMTWALKTSATWNISPLWGACALTLTSRSSRCSAGSPVRSVTRITSIRRLSCFLICSTMRSSPWHARVILVTVGSAVITGSDALQVVAPARRRAPRSAPARPACFQRASTQYVSCVCPMHSSSRRCRRRREPWATRLLPAKSGSPGRRACQ